MEHVRSVYTTIGGGSAGTDPFAPQGTAEVRNVLLPAGYGHIDLPRAEHLAADATLRAWIEAYVPGATPPPLSSSAPAAAQRPRISFTALSVAALSAAAGSNTYLRRAREGLSGLRKRLDSRHICHPLRFSFAHTRINTLRKHTAQQRGAPLPRLPSLT